MLNPLQVGSECPCRLAGGLRPCPVRDRTCGGHRLHNLHATTPHPTGLCCTTRQTPLLDGAGPRFDADLIEVPEGLSDVRKRSSNLKSVPLHSSTIVYDDGDGGGGDGGGDDDHANGNDMTTMTSTRVSLASGA